MTKSQKTEMYAQIEQHGNNLNVLFNTGIEPVKLCKSLLRLENKANKIATDYCNGVIESDYIDTHTKPILDKVNALLKNKIVPIFFNGDARGYTLKISDKYIRELGVKIYTDMGGYGILAPDFTV